MRGNKIRGLCWLIRYNAQTLPRFVYWYQHNIFCDLRKAIFHIFRHYRCCMVVVSPCL